MQGSRLEILERLPKRRVRCRCVCGIVKEYAYDNVVSGRTKSCGCLRAELRRETGKRLGKARAGTGRCARVNEGERFGRLLVLRLMPVGNAIRTYDSARMWLCRCDCGNLCTVRADRLAAGRREDEPYSKDEPKRKSTRSCGCRRQAWVKRQLHRWELAWDGEVERAKERELRSAELEKLLVEA